MQSVRGDAIVTLHSNDLILLEENGTKVAINLRYSKRARRYRISVAKVSNSAILTLPVGGSLKAAANFIHETKDWIFRLTRHQFPPLPFKVGAKIPLRGEEHIIANIAESRGTVNQVFEPEGPTLYVFGDIQHLSRRLTDWLKKQALDDLVKHTKYFSEKLGKRPTKISIKDTTRQWGSCSSSGKLSFSWRLILMPPKILEYVVAHEVAHLEEMNHSYRFWKITKQLCDHTSMSRNWLKQNGDKFHAYGMATTEFNVESTTK